MIGEPPPTQADLHFRAFGVPVRVHPWFWIIALLLGLGGSEKADLLETVLWVAVVFFSILVHELGHAFVQRRYGGHPRITLYGMGGLATCDDCDRSPRSQILISLAGPFAGFLLAGVTVLFLYVKGRLYGFHLALEPVAWKYFDPSYLLQHNRLSPRDALIEMLLWVNILWGVINLFPIYPLDGGRISRELFTLGNPREGIIRSLQLSIGTAALLAVWGFTRSSIYTAILFAYFAYGNYQTLRAYQNYRA
ncbi:MAG TPA: site-2 protease family protein [Lacipirellulaceae bacterium]|jgi:Zn-dependent protease